LLSLKITCQSIAFLLREYPISFEVYLRNSNTTSPGANVESERMLILNHAKKTAWDLQQRKTSLIPMPEVGLCGREI
jgi:hypothetical protein